MVQLLSIWALEGGSSRTAIAWVMADAAMIAASMNETVFLKFFLFIRFSFFVCTSAQSGAQIFKKRWVISR